MEITIRRPDDMHAHLRDGSLMKFAVPFSNIYGRVVAMGNLTPPIISGDDVIKYRMEIKKNSFLQFKPIVTAMLVNSTTLDIIRDVGEVTDVLKLIPGGASTNSESGVGLENLEKYYFVLKATEEAGMIFSGHWELTNNPATGREIPEIERETAAIPYLEKIVKNFPRLRIVVEHASTREMIKFVEKAPTNVTATLTAHHAILTYDKVRGKNGKIINPHLYCKPIAKLASDRQAVIEAMLSGNPKFFFGSDSAPHLPERKKLPNPQAGIFTPGEVAIPLLAEIFETFGESEKLENFVSRFGAEFYGLPLNGKFITLKKEKWAVPKKCADIVPFMAGHELDWQITE